MPVVSTTASSAVAAALLPANGSATSGAAPGDDSRFAAMLTGIGQTAGATDETSTGESGVDGTTPVVDPATPPPPMTTAESGPDMLAVPPSIAPSVKSAGGQPLPAGAAHALLAALQAAAPQASTPAQSSQPAPANDGDGSDQTSENPSAASAPADTASILPLVPQSSPDETDTAVVSPPHTVSTAAAKNSAAKSEPDDGKDGVAPAVSQNNDVPNILAALAVPIIAPVAPAATAPAAMAAGNAISGIGDSKNQPPPVQDAPTAPSTAPESEDADAAAPFDQAALAAQSAQAKHAAKAAPALPTGAGKSASATGQPADPSAATQTQQTKADAVQNAAGDVTPAANNAAPQSAAAGTPDNMPANLPPSLTVSAPVAAQLSQHAGASVHVRVDVSPPAPNLASLAVAISTKSQSGARQFDIRLDPPELGRVDVRLSIDAAGKAQAHLSAEHSQTLDLLQKDSGALTRALREAGLDVSQSGLNFSLKGQDRQAGNGFSGSHASPARNLIATKTIDAVQSANPYRSSAGDARLDIHV